MKKTGIKSKIILLTLVCVISVSLFGNIILYNYLRRVISKQNDQINSMYLSTVASQLNTYIENGLDLGIQCAIDTQILRVMNGQEPYTESYLTIQKKLNNYLTTYLGAPYVNKLIVFNKEGTMVQATNQRLFGNSADFESLMSLTYFEQLDPGENLFQYSISFSPTMDTRTAQQSRDALVILCQAQRTTILSSYTYVYIEITPELFDTILSPYTGTTDIFLVADGTNFITPVPKNLPDDFLLESISANGTATINGTLYQFEEERLPYAGLSLYLCYPVLAGWNDQLLYPLFIVVLMSLIIAVLLSVMISRYISRPVEKLKNRLKLIAENDFSFDPEIESSQDELGQMGRTVNEMTLSISQLLTETKQMYEQQKNIELSLLQSQVNPHFLYNTLDSIRWMAVVQKNEGIEHMVQRLINLLKNIAKGTQDKIALSEEIALLEDYIEIQNIRYMGAFTFVNKVPEELLNCRIVKFTLQPLVENAIFHGIEPAEQWGEILLTAREEDGCLIVSVRDDGVGIPPEKLKTILSGYDKPSRSGLSGLGIANVHQRIRLVYGSPYGLSVDSEVGVYTKIDIRLPIEE